MFCDKEDISAIIMWGTFGQSMKIVLPAMTKLCSGVAEILIAGTGEMSRMRRGLGCVVIGIWNEFGDLVIEC